MKKLILLLFIPAVLSMRCKTTTGGGGEQLTVSPAKGSPGATVFLARGEGSFEKTEGLQVNFGKMPASILGTDGMGHLQVMVPMLDAGQISISVLENGKSIGSAAFEVMPAAARQLILQMNSDGKLDLMSAKPVASDYDRTYAMSVEQLSYDVLSADGNLLFSASIAHPIKQRKEVFENPEGVVHREKQASPAVFAVKIPNLAEAVVVRFYEAPANADLTDPAIRQNRKLLSEIKLR